MCVHMCVCVCVCVPMYYVVEHVCTHVCVCMCVHMYYVFEHMCVRMCWCCASVRVSVVMYVRSAVHTHHSMGQLTLLCVQHAQEVISVSGVLDELSNGGVCRVCVCVCVPWLAYPPGGEGVTYVD